MKKVIIIGTKSEVDYVIECVKDSEKYSFVILNSVDEIENSIFDVIDSKCIINAHIDYHLSSIAFNVLSSINLLKDRVIHFSKVANSFIPQMTVERVMSNPYIREYECLVLGLSHAEVGIDEKRLPFPTANLAVSSQDIYFNLQAIKYCAKHYGEKIKNLKKVYIDMFDYTYFNFDTSLSSAALMYYAAGGIFLPHNIRNNKSFGETEFGEELYDSIIRKLNEGITDNQLLLWEELFGDNILKTFENRGYKNKPFLDLRDKVFDPSVYIDNNIMNTGIINRKHEQTIAENKSYFKELLDYIFAINPNMSVELIITPQHKIVSGNVSDKMNEWKNEFYEIIEEFKYDYKFEFKDFRMNEMSNHNIYFYDAEHLNYFGAKCFTNKLING